ncbi:MAG TPA: hypothetical protein VGH23_16300 [Rhizomicrobium sp.]|jgi:hypothetical protein
MSMPPVVEAFVELARRYVRAERHYDNMAATGNRDRVDDALSSKQELEEKVCQHFMLVRPLDGAGSRR